MKAIEKIERKYSKRVDRLLKKMQDNTMGELWIELDKLKAKMAEELKGVVEVES